MSPLETVQKNRDLFLKFNNEKLKRFQNLITNTNLKRVILSLPLLLCVNDKRVPGYVEGDLVCGIMNYIPDDETVKFVRARFHLSNLNIEKEKPFIEMLAVMGSVGTIAYTKESDFDFWVCIDRRNATPVQLSNLKKKVEGVQVWVMNEIKTDVHLFVNDIESIKKSVFAEDDEEAFGTAAGAVLKDEFYRSSIIIAGKVPFWWAVSRSVTDTQYDEMYTSLPNEVKEKEFVDLGNLYEISKEDFLGAALFQLIKSLGNPFKSIIKIGVLEKYLFGTSDSPLLSQKVKMNIQSDNLDNRILDSYILMFEEVYTYYDSTIEDKKLLNILRQNLYLKISPQLSKYAGMKQSHNLPYKVIVMFDYIKKWNWGINEIKSLDNFENWDYNSVMAFWNLVKKFMLLTYQRISQQLPTLNIAQKVSESDFMLLSRKIKAHFSQEKNKIDHYVTFKDIPYESILYIDPINKSVDEHEWRLFKRDTSTEEKFNSTTLRIENDLIKLLAWSGINEIFHPQFSRIKIQSGYSRINQNMVVDLLTRISMLFSRRNVVLKNEYMLRSAFHVTTMVLMNFNLENEESIKTISHIYKTSWGESFIESLHTAEELMAVLQCMLADSLNLKRSFDECCIIFSPEPFRKLYKEIETVFRESYEFIVKKSSKISHRIVASIGDNYVTVLRSQGDVTVELFPNPLKMYTSISVNPQMQIAHTFIGDAPGINVMKEMYNIRKDNAITIVFEERKDAIIVYVINERGNLFAFVRSIKQKEEVLLHLYGFCLNVILHVNSSKTLSHIKDEISFYRLVVDKFGNMQFENQTRWCEEVYVLKYKIKKLLQISIDNSAEGKNLYQLIFPNKTKTQPIDMERIQGVVKTLKGKGMDVANCVTNVTFTKQEQNVLDAGSSPYFFEKYRIEFMINAAMRQ